MDGGDALTLVAAGVAAGTVNSVVGSGGLITFPVLLAYGLSPVNANVTNTVGVLGGAIGGTFGYRRELVGQKERLIRLGSASLIGGVIGSALLLSLPSSTFEAVVPVLILIAVALVLLQPLVARRVGDHVAAREHGIAGGLGLWIGVMLTGVYGGYFGAAQGVILLGLMGLLLLDDLQRINAAKNVLAVIANGVAAVMFMIFAWSDIDWAAAGMLTVGSAVGGLVGSRYGRRLPPNVLRALIVVVGLVAAVKIVAW